MEKKIKRDFKFDENKKDAKPGFLNFLKGDQYSNRKHKLPEKVTYHPFNTFIKNTEGKIVAEVFGRVVLKPLRCIYVTDINVSPELKAKYFNSGGPGVGRLIVNELKRISHEKDFIIYLYDATRKPANHNESKEMYKKKYNFLDMPLGPNQYYSPRKLSQEELRTLFRIFS